MGCHVQFAAATQAKKSWLIQRCLKCLLKSNQYTDFCVSQMLQWQTFSKFCYLVSQKNNFTQTFWTCWKSNVLIIGLKRYINLPGNKITFHPFWEQNSTLMLLLNILFMMNTASPAHPIYWHPNIVNHFSTFAIPYFYRLHQPPVKYKLMFAFKRKKEKKNLLAYLFSVQNEYCMLWNKIIIYC